MVSSSPPTADFDERSEMARVAALSLQDQLDRVLDDRLLRPTDKKPEWHEFVRVSAFDLAERCDRRAAMPADDFADSVHTARRRVGLLVLRRSAHDGTGDLVESVRSVMEDSSGWPQGLWDWTRELDPAGRSAVAAASLTWAASLARLVAPSPSARQKVAWADPAMPPRFDVPGRLIRISAPFEASTGRPRAAVLLSVVDGVPAASDRLRAGLVALVRTLQHRLAPVRVSLASPSRGRVEPFGVDEALLQLSVDHVVELVAKRSDPDRAVPRPSGGCRFCHLLDVCPEGTAYLRDAAEGADHRGTP